jgi:exoribonuclease R
MSGDKVEVVIAGREKDAKYVNKVLKVISRSKKAFVGTIKISGNNTEIIPDDRKIKALIKILGEKPENIKNNEKTLLSTSNMQISTMPTRSQKISSPIHPH